MSDSLMQRSEIDAAANDWLVRKTAGDLDASEEARFQDWLAADARHRQAWQESWFAWEDMARLTHLAERETLQPAALRERLALWLQRSTAAGCGALLRPVYAVAAIAALLAVTIWLVAPFPSATSGFAELYSTKVAEIRDFRLPDGSTITLGAKSSAGWSTAGNTRRITLLEGEAFFAVAGDAARPFVVQAGDTEVRVIGTQFDIHRGPGTLRVAVAAGAVQVSRVSGATDDVRRLQAGQQIVVAHAQPLGAVRNIDIKGAGDWRNGRLVYEDVTLDEVIADANRYYDGEIQFAANELRGLKITASFQTTEIEQFIDTLLTVLPVKVARPEPGRIVLW